MIGKVGGYYNPHQAVVIRNRRSPTCEMNLSVKKIKRVRRNRAEQAIDLRQLPLRLSGSQALRLSGSQAETSINVLSSAATRPLEPSRRVGAVPIGSSSPRRRPRVSIHLTRWEVVGLSLRARR